MGFESKISGYIASHNTLGEESTNAIESVINSLPNLEDDKWPFLPRDIFNLSKPLSIEANPVQISYRSAMVHFSMSVKEIEDSIQAWLEKFENFFKQIPGVYEANVDIHCLYSGKYKNGNLNYHWKANTDRDGKVSWNFKGDPTNIEDMVNPVHFAHSYFSETLKEEVIKNMQWLASKAGRTITLTDKISRVKGNYDRHFTRITKFRTKLDHFKIRTSGAIGMIEGDNITFEFKTDNIRRIRRDENKLEIESVLDLNSSRLININVNEPDDNVP